MRNCKPRHVEHGREVDGNDLVPVVRRIFGDRQGQPSDPGIVDKHVKPAQRRNRVRHHALDLGAARHVAAPGDQTRDLFGNGSERLVVDVADEDFCAIRREGARKFSTDTRGAGRYQDTLRHDSGINQIILPTARQRASTFTPAARSHIKCANRLRFSAAIRGLPILRTGTV